MTTVSQKRKLTCVELCAVTAGLFAVTKWIHLW